jgi:saccharopine dehydrogenase (NAD+, L-lysine-forming)
MSKPMVDACVATGTHYLDITGEISVFEALALNSGTVPPLGGPGPFGGDSTHPST